MRAFLCCTLAALVAACGGLSADDTKGEKIDVTKLIGKWEPKEKKEGHSAVIEFKKDGKASATISGDGKEETIDGTYAVDGNKLTVTMKFTDMEVTRTRTVSRCTGTELVSTDEKGKEETLVRVKEKK